MILAVVSDSPVVVIHRGFASAVIIYSIFMAIWGLILYFRGAGPSGGYLGALIINEGLVIAQGLVGVLLVLQGHRPHQGLHFLYGIVALLTLPTAYFLSSNDTERRASLIFGLAALFLVAIAIRGITTGQGS